MLLFGKHEDATEKFRYINCDIKDWEHAGASNLSWTFSTGVTDDIDHARALILKAEHKPCVAAGILFTVERDGRGKEGGLEGGMDGDALGQIAPSWRGWDAEEERCALPVHGRLNSRAL